MPVYYAYGNLFEAMDRNDSVGIFHGCNAQGRRASGFAKGLMEYLKKNFNYPATEQDDIYANLCKREVDKGNLLGKLIVENMPSKLTVLNGITQLNYGRDPNQVYISYKHLRKSLEKALLVCINNDLELVMPMVGVGLGGGDAVMLDRTIRAAASKFPKVNVIIYTLDPTCTHLNRQ